MKHIVRKNQIIITALAIMIAVAGYLNYSGNALKKEADLAAQSAAQNQVLLTTEDTARADELDDSALIDVESLDADAELEEASAQTQEGEAQEAEVNTTPGEAILTSTGSGSAFIAEAKLNREQIRAKNKETLLEVINNENIAEEQKQEAVASMTSITDIAEREAAAELLLEAKGFLDCVVSVTDGMADVVVNQAELSEAERAQIEDIVKRKTGIDGANIVITPRVETE